MAKPTIHCFLVLSLFIYVCRSQFAEKYTGINPCTVKEKCSACIQTPTCAWCSEPGFLNYPRCFQPSAEAPLGHCDESYIYQAEVSYSEMMSKTLTKGGASRSANMSASGGYSGSYSGMSSSQFSSSESHSFSHSESSAREVIQISPQKVTLKLKINESYRFDVSFAQAEDYPVDLYYLMDLSRSMADDKDNLSKLGDLLSASMKKLTSNFRLGFGSFVDKVVMPYVSTVPKNLVEPCSKCTAPYGYRNGMSLSTNTTAFSEEVRKAAVSGNLDAPEGGFDAIMQAIVCGEIGWRPKARRLLVFSTDAGFHYAGDGKLGGIVKPNDGECHMKNREYAYSSVQDYPSISQINVKVKENAINMIFAVTEEQISVYDQLKDLIEGSTAGKLTNDSSNVVKLIQEQYGKITSSVQMSDNSTGPISIKYYSSCLGEGPLKQTSKCDGLKVGQMVKFTAEFLVTSCPKDRKKWTQTIKIYPVGINESLIVDLEMLCDCPCERAGHSAYKEKSPSCSGHGTYTCGVCDCDPQHFGVSCECSGNQYNINNNTSSCISDINTLLECSGHGTCTCGQCKCDEGPNGEPITGKYCECNNFQCDHHNGLLCSGPDHGECVCGGCVCKDGWSGVACDCKTSNNTCIPPGGGDICSNHGHCVCGQCVCDGVPNEKGYFGRYCDKCPNCSDRQCSQYNECVQCKQFKSGPKMKDDRCDKECAFEPIPVDKVEANVDKDENLCTYTDEDFCRFFYVYSYDENNKLIIHVQTKKECPPQVFMLGIVLGVIAAIVLIGLAVLLLWKMVTTIHDRREFARFEKERMMAKWDTGENPIYKQATSTFKNPTYAGR